MKVEDSFSTRVCKLETQTLVLQVENTIPMMITDDTKIQDYVLKTEANAGKVQDNQVTLSDEEYQKVNSQERFIFMANIKSPLTNNNAYLYYDAKYQDILITPPVNFYNMGLSNMTYTIRVSRLGAGEDLSGYSWNLNVPVSEHSRYFLPTTKSKIATVKTHLMGLPGIGTNSNNTRDDSYEEMIDSKVNLKHNIRRLGTLVELGTPSDIFVTPSNIPLYLLYQSSMMEYGIKYISNISRPSNKIYFRLKF